MHNSDDVLFKFRFMYFEAKEINEHNVIGTLYAAEKYDVTDLVDICRSYLESNMAESTVCVIMENARVFNMAELFSKCVNFILHCEDTSKMVFDSPGFLQLRRECLKALVEADDLPLDEAFIYQSLIRWAKHNCEKKHRDQFYSKELRKILGDLLYEIRFPTMSLEEFWKDIVQDGVLLNDEKVQISEQILGRCVENPVFKTMQRKELYPIKGEVFRTVADSTSCCWQHNNLIDAIDFEVNKHVVLVGILLYGNIDIQYTYDVEVKVISKGKVAIHVPRKKLQETEKIIRIKFDKPCKINPDEKYTLWVKLNGPSSFRGEYSSCVNHKNYVFKFHRSEYCTNGTCESYGQIPGLLCNLK